MELSVSGMGVVLLDVRDIDILVVFKPIVDVFFDGWGVPHWSEYLYLHACLL